MDFKNYLEDMTRITNKMPYSILIADGKLKIVSLNHAAKMNDQLVDNPEIFTKSINKNQLSSILTKLSLGKFVILSFNQKTDKFLHESFVIFHSLFDEQRELNYVLAFVIPANSLVDLSSNIFFISEEYATIAHEFRMPLSIILSALNILETNSIKSGDNKNLSYINNIKKNCNKLLRLSNNFMALIKQSPEIDPVDYKNIDTISLVENLVFTVKQLLGIDISYSVRISQKPLFVECDMDKIERVLLNLISNAIKATKSENRKIHIRVTEWRRQVRIMVVDNGIGIAEEHLPFIFNPFFSKYKDSSNQNSGLGLFIAKSIMNIHNGNILVRSKPERGSVFAISFPKDSEENANLYMKSGSDQGYNSHDITQIYIELSDLI